MTLDTVGVSDPQFPYLKDERKNTTISRWGELGTPKEKRLTDQRGGDGRDLETRNGHRRGALETKVRQILSCVPHYYLRNAWGWGTAHTAWGVLGAVTLKASAVSWAIFSGVF